MAHMHALLLWSSSGFILPEINRTGTLLPQQYQQQCVDAFLGRAICHVPLPSDAASLSCLQNAFNSGFLELRIPVDARILALDQRGNDVDRRIEQAEPSSSHTARTGTLSK